MLLAEKLLKNLYELEGLTSRLKWSETQFAHNPPRNLRYRQICAILQYLKSELSPKDFVLAPINEKIIENKEYYLDIFNELLLPVEGLDRFQKSNDLVVTWWYLYDFRTQVHNSFTCNFISSGMGNYSIGEHMIKHLEIQLANELEWVDRYLYMVVDPDLRKLDIEYLVQNFDYPDVDFKKVDGDNL